MNKGNRILGLFIVSVFVMSIFAVSIIAPDEDVISAVTNDVADTAIPPAPTGDVVPGDLARVALARERMIVGNDSDEHGCKASAGYSWCKIKGKCLRPWEEPCDSNNTIIRKVSLENIRPVIANTAQCIPDAYYKKLNELNNQIMDKMVQGGDVSELKSQVESVTQQIIALKANCTKIKDASQPSGVAVGLNCDISQEDKILGNQLREEYKNAIASNDTATIKAVREKMVQLEQSVKDKRLACMSSIVPGLVANKNLDACKVPEEYYDKLESARAKIADAKSRNATIPAEAEQIIADMESKIAAYKARCNALNVTKDAREDDVAAYYRQKIDDALSTNDPDAKLQSLKELRSEIDETIKNMVAAKKNLNYNQISPVAHNLRIRANNVEIGDSQVNTTDADIEFEISGRNIHIRPSKVGAILKDAGLNITNITADDITVNDSGIYVSDVLVKMLPNAVFENNKNLERNAGRIIEMKLEKEGNNAVYKAKYNAKKKVLGIIPANAHIEEKVDATTGKTISEKKPWWNGISTDANDESPANATAEN